MAGFRRSSPPALKDLAATRLPPRALVAAASQVELKGQGINSLKIGEQEWQKEAWRQYDICGELRFVANRRGAQLSLCKLVVMEVDDLGKPTKPAEDEKVTALGEVIAGGPASKAEMLRIVGVQQFVAGECYMVGQAGGAGAITKGDKKKDGKDAWYVVSAADISKQAGSLKVKRPAHAGGGEYVLGAKDLLIRMWTPHPRSYDLADSPTRSVLPVLREIERLSMLSFSQIDSRLISAGLMLFPDGIDFPHAQDKPGGVAGLMEQVLTAAQASLSGSGTAAGLVPIMATIPTGTGSDVQHMKFDTPLTGEIKDKLDHAIRRLALGLDSPPEVLLGQGAANHWSAWQISEDEITTQVVPVITRICDALTTAYLAPALEAIGKDPEKYTLWFDTSALTVRPNRFEDALKLYEKGLLSAEELLATAAFEAPMESKERQQWMAWELAKLNPEFVKDPVISELLGMPELTAAPADEGYAPEELPAEEPPPEDRSLPAEPEGASPAQDGGAEGFALAAVEQAVLRAMEIAGGRLLDRSTRGAFTSTPKHELHTRARARDMDHAQKLLEGGFAHVGTLAGHLNVSPSSLEWLLRGYCAELLIRGLPHETELLAATLKTAGSRRGA